MPIFRVPPEWTIGENLPDTTEQNVGNGAVANLNTVEIMKKVARSRSRHPVVRSLAQQILTYYNITDHHYLDEAQAITQYVKNKVRYIRDIRGVETLTDPLTLIDQIKRGTAQGDCDDISLLIATLLLSIGHLPFFRIVKYRGRTGSYNHIYVVVYEKNPGMKKPIRLVLDGIMKNKPIGWEVPHKFGQEIKS